MAKAAYSSAIIFGALVAAPASAQTPEAAVLAPFEECAALSDATERLACYDNAIGRARSVAEVNIAEREKQRRDEFGLNTVQREERDQDDERTKAIGIEEDVREINANISNAYADARTGYRLFILDNGQIWQESSKGTLRRTPNEGAAIAIRRGGVGGFQLRVKDKKGFTYVKRLK
jgi:hypothetical protein